MATVEELADRVEKLEQRRRGGATYELKPEDAAVVPTIREAVRARVENVSLRGVAREIGISPTGLSKFIKGTNPYGPTLQRLRKWYLRYATVMQPAVSLEEARMALHILTHDLSPWSRRKVTDYILNSLELGYDETGRPRPRWLTDLHSGSTTA